MNKEKLFLQLDNLINELFEDSYFPNKKDVLALLDCMVDLGDKNKIADEYLEWYYKQYE